MNHKPSSIRVRCERCHGHGRILQPVGVSVYDRHQMNYLPCLCPDCDGKGEIPIDLFHQRMKDERKEARRA